MAYKWTDNAIATATSVAGEDLLLFVDDPSGTPVSKKITVANLQSSLSVTESQISDFGTYLPASSVSAFGLTLIDDANAAAARTTIGVDPAGTDNSTNVTLAGVYDYLTISGQEITLGQVDYNTDIANLPTIPSAPAVEISAGLPVFATGITAAEMRTLIGVDAAGTDNSTDVTLAGAYDYLTLIGQQITLGQVDLSTDVTGTLPSGNIGSHTHVASDITDFSEAVDDRSASLLTAGTDISITYNDVAGTLTVAYTGTSGATSLDGLTDVSAPTPTTGDLIRWSGTAWVNYADSNYAAASHTHAASDVTSGTFADARISQSSVTQHQAALSITESQISDLGTYQPLDAGLTSIAGLTTAADRMIYTTALDTYAVATLTAFGRSLLDDADAATARATLGVDAAGTDNSTDVTLAGPYDYLTIAGQAITLGQVDLATDVTGLLPHENGGLEADVSLYSGLLKISGGVTSSVADNSTNWDAAYTHSQVATGNPHSVTASDVGLGNVENTALSTWAGSANITTVGQSAVTQHQAALSITESQISDFGTYQDYDAGLASIAGLPTIADKMLYTTATDTYATTTLSSFARSILDDADAATVRTTIGVDAAGTDNSTNVTLAGTYNYLTLSGQQITLGQIDLTTDVTGALPVANGGTGATTAAGARTALGVDAAGTDNSTDVTLAGIYDYLTLSGQQITLAQIDLTTDVTGNLPYANAAFADQDLLTTSSPTFVAVNATIDGGSY